MKSRSIFVWMAVVVPAVVMIVIGFGTFHAQAAQGSPSAQERPRHHGPGGRGFGGFGPGPMMRHVDNLTDAQRDQLRAIMESHQGEMRPLMEQLRTARTALEDAVFGNPADEATIRLKSADVAAAEAELAVQRARLTAEFLTVLTPEQQQQLKQHHSEFKQHRAERAETISPQRQRR